MEYTKEQIDKLEELLYERAVDGNDDISHHAITYINELKKQLKLYSVSQQRELLIAYEIESNKPYNIRRILAEEKVDRIMKAINCG